MRSIRISKTCAAEIGDRVDFTHDVAMIGPVPGSSRVLGLVVDEEDGSLIQVQADEAFTQEAGRNYAVVFRLKDGTRLYRALTTTAGTSRTLTFAIPIAVGDDWPDRGDLVAFGETEEVVVPMIVKAITPVNDLAAKLTLLDYGEPIFTAEDEIPAYVPKITWPADRVMARPSKPVIASIISDESALVEQSGGSFQSRILIYVTPQTGELFDLAELQAEYRIQDSGDGYRRQSFPAESTEISLLPVEDEEIYEIRLRYVTRLGVPGDWALISDHAVVGQSSLPDEPAGLYVEELPGETRRYTVIYGDRPLDFAGFEFRWHLGNKTHWDSATVAHTGLVSADSFEAAAFATRTFTVLVKAVDKNGNYSENAAAAVVALGDWVTENLVDSQDYAAQDFPGVITNGIIEDGALKAVTSGALFSNGSQPLFDDPDGSLLSSFADLIYQAGFRPAYAGYLQLVTGIEGTASLSYCEIGNAPLFTEALNPLFTDPDEPLIPAGDWLTYKGPFKVDPAKSYCLRATCAGGGNQPVISTFRADVDVETAHVNIEDHSIAGGSGRLPLSTNWTKIIKVDLTLQQADGHEAVTAKVVDKDPALGPLIECRDGNGDLAAGMVDVTIQGIAA